MNKIAIEKGLLFNYSLLEIKQLAERFKCIAEEKKTEWIFETDDVINFYWLGMNMANKISPRLR